MASNLLRISSYEHGKRYVPHVLASNPLCSQTVIMRHLVSPTYWSLQDQEGLLRIHGGLHVVLHRIIAWNATLDGCLFLLFSMLLS
jgi:hypothetical protein